MSAISDATPPSNTSKLDVLPPKKPSMMSHATPTAKVSAFCRAVLSHLIPLEFWGSGEIARDNERILHQNVNRFIELRRFEAMSLHQVTQGLKVNKTSSHRASSNTIRSPTSNGLPPALKAKLHSLTSLKDGSYSTNWFTTSLTLSWYRSFDPTFTSPNRMFIDTVYSISVMMCGGPWLSLPWHPWKSQCSRRSSWRKLKNYWSHVSWASVRSDFCQRKLAWGQSWIFDEDRWRRFTPQLC